MIIELLLHEDGLDGMRNRNVRALFSLPLHTKGCLECPSSMKTLSFIPPVSPCMIQVLGYFGQFGSSYLVTEDLVCFLLACTRIPEIRWLLTRDISSI